MSDQLAVNGFKFNYDLSTDKEGWYKGIKDVWALKRCQEMDLIHGLAVDLGAHKGLYSLIIAQMADETISVEPKEQSFFDLQKNISLNPDLNISAVRCACTGALGDVRIYETHYETLVMPDIPRDQLNLAQVPCKKLMDITGGREPDFVKIDTEGLEQEIVMSNHELFKGRANFYIELHPQYIKKFDWMDIYIDRSKYNIHMSGNELFGKRK